MGIYAFIFFFLQMPRSKKCVKRPELSQEQEKIFNDAAEAVRKGMALRTASKNFNVPRSTIRRIVQCDGIYKFTLNCAVNQVFFRGRRITSEISVNCIKNALWTFST
jgi:hypothetical protein